MPFLLDTWWVGHLVYLTVMRKVSEHTAKFIFLNSISRINLLVVVLVVLTYRLTPI